MKNRFLMAVALVAGMFVFASANSASAFTLFGGEAGGCGCEAEPTCCEPAPCCKVRKPLFSHCRKPKCCEAPSCCEKAVEPTCEAKEPTCGCEVDTCCKPKCGFKLFNHCCKPKCPREPKCCREPLFSRCCKPKCCEPVCGCEAKGPSCGCGA